MSIDIPLTEDLAELTKHRSTGSVTIYVASGWTGANGSRPPIAHDTEAARIALRSAAGDALAQLGEIGLSRTERERLSAAIEQLDSDRDFWGTSARTIAVFASPEKIRAFRLMNELPQHTAVGDRFDVGPLLRATTFIHSGYVLALTEGEVRLLLLKSDASSRELELTTLPDDAATALETTATDGRFDRHRADGTLGSKARKKRYCSIVQDAVLDVIGGHTLPLVLAAAAELDPAYREVNSYRGLLPQGIEANPSSLSLDELEGRGRAVLDAHFAAELERWREEFGTLRAHGRASSQLSDIAKAATAGLVDTFLFDLEANEEGEIDEAGTIIVAAEAGPTTHGLADEIAARVLRTGGTVKAVRSGDLPDDSSVAATFRSAP